MLDEIKYRYRSIKLTFRLAFVALLACIPGAMSYLDQAPLLEEELTTAKGREANERQQLATAKSHLKNLSAMEEKLAFTSDQLKKAEVLLPNDVLPDQVIDQLGKAAKESDVFVRYFAPAGQKTIEGEYPYDEVRFKVYMGGKFPKLTKWMDIFAGVDSRAYLKSWEFVRLDEKASTRLKNPDVNSVTTNAPPEMTQQQSADAAKKARDEYQLDLKTEIVYYRLASNTPAKPAEKSNGDSNPTPTQSPEKPNPGAPPP